MWPKMLSRGNRLKAGLRDGGQLKILSRREDAPGRGSLYAKTNT